MLTKRTFPNTKQAVDELQKGTESSLLIENETLAAGETTYWHVSSRERWLIFNKSMNSCQIKMKNGKIFPVRLSIKRAVAIHIPAGRAYTLSSDARVAYRTLEVE